MSTSEHLSMHAIVNSSALLQHSSDSIEG